MRVPPPPLCATAVSAVSIAQPVVTGEVTISHTDHPACPVVESS